MSFRFLYGAGFNGAGELLMKNCFNSFFKFEKCNNSFIKRNFKTLRDCKGLFTVVFRFEFRKAFFNSKESLIGIIQMNQRALKRLTVNFLQSWMNNLESRDCLFQKCLGRFFPNRFVRVYTDSKEVIIYEPDRTKVLGKKNFLLFGWVESIFKRFKHYALLYLSSSLVLYKSIKVSIGRN